MGALTACVAAGRKVPRQVAILARFVPSSPTKDEKTDAIGEYASKRVLKSREASLKRSSATSTEEMRLGLVDPFFGRKY